MEIIVPTLIILAILLSGLLCTVLSIILCTFAFPRSYDDVPTDPDMTKLTLFLGTLIPPFGYIAIITVVCILLFVWTEPVWMWIINAINQPTSKFANWIYQNQRRRLAPSEYDVKVALIEAARKRMKSGDY